MLHQIVHLSIAFIYAATFVTGIHFYLALCALYVVLAIIQH